MIVHLFILIFSIFIVEIIYFFQLFNKFQILFLTIRKIFTTILSKNISDHWKEKSLLRYSQLVLFNSVLVFGILLLILLFYFGVSYFYQPFSVYIISIIGIIETTVIVSVYVYLRKLIYAKL